MSSQPTSLPGRLSAGPARRNRAVALVVTVLLLAVAATIVLALAAEAVTSSRTSASEANNADATILATNAESALTSALQNNPYFYLSGVFTDTISGELYSENARVCLPTGALVEPGQAWSVAACGTTWAYVSPTTTPNAWVEITAPSLSNPDLVVDIEGEAGGDSSAVQLSYHLIGPEHYTLWSANNLDLTQLSTGSALSGSIYSAGKITLPTNSSLLTSAQLEAEQGFTSTPTDTKVRYYAQSTTSATPPVEDIRDVAPAVLTTQSLQSSLQETHALACPGTAPWWDANTNTASSLCLNAGASVLLNATTPVKIPTNVTAYLLIFNGAANTVSVYYSVNPINADQSCATQACDYVTQGQSDASASPLTNPGILNYWTTNGNAELGTLPLPADGLIATDQDTYLSSCSSGSDATFAVLNATCPTLSGTSPGMLVDSNITIAAGTALSPANVYVDGSINVGSADTFGVVASGSLYLPYWGHTPGATSTETLDGSYAALGQGVDEGVSAIASYPNAVGGDSANPDDVAGSLDINGSLATPDLSLTLPFSYFSEVNLSSSATLVSAAPPYYANFDGTWVLANNVAIDPATLVPPAAPSAVSATAGATGSGQATVTWTSPGSGTSQYFLVITNGATQTCISTTTSCTVDGLSSGTQHTFSVLTIDPPNASLDSSASNSVTLS